ncbi:hypothetical protein S7335_4831 [Synechococcus sp. PCC 7335]|uniref:hypothetical protein n=1 Tax=Synechococcus sp. (strain ATCC 29403 / PCC 7335) TaxID=91464 RepID=UPI00017EB08B|nr:hypothetical protein [Synechococcus sp. PCC 7335]EDX87124.1 hypothetical protein S7335_4831 [Synechococcus sp. PCC 7335]
MIFQSYQAPLKSHLSARQYLLLSLLVTVLQTCRDVRLETLVEALPLPIVFESRRKKFNGSLHWVSLT